LHSCRRLQSPNVVKYYGTCVSHVEDKTYPLYVMEYCKKTLAEEVYDSNYPAPGNCQSYTAVNFAPAMRKAARYALEVSSGLMAIHQYGYLHRDLKPENILVSGSVTI
jgi:serine/threonine protein kinase